MPEVRKVGPSVRFAALPVLCLCAAAPAMAQKVMSVAELVRTVKPAVVYIATFDSNGQQMGFGSGFVVDENGVIVTNLHVIKGSQALKVKMANGDVYDKVDIQGFDERRDIAVLRIRPFSKLPIVYLGDSDGVEIGEDAVAVGNPKGMENTVTKGVVSAFRQEEGYRLIQIDVSISPGSSGGPLFDLQGRVIGITTAQLRGEGVQNLNFAVPINYVNPLIKNPQAQTFTLKQVNESLGAEPPPDSRQTADAKGWYAVVAHDHLYGSFNDKCGGQLYVKNGRIGFATPGKVHDFEVPIDAIKEVKRNESVGALYQAFHVKLKTGANYNFAALNDSGQPISPDEVIYTIMRAMQ